MSKICLNTCALKLMFKDAFGVILWVTGIGLFMYSLGTLGKADGFLGKMATGLLLSLFICLMLLVLYFVCDMFINIYKDIVKDVKIWYRNAERRCDSNRRK